MFLKSLEIQGFKSFPDKTLLRFGQGITAVVGPNGSGKSNISDAIRWVLGEMSAKTLRGSRMEDVIFGGTLNRKAQGFAEVSLTIDNAGRELAADSDEVTVTRRYYRSGESEYLLNRASVRLRDVYELFMDTGLGRDGYSIIGQGKIAEIVSAKSDDRREIFEEAAGISKYRYRKEESERRLAATEENLERLRDILSELESRVEPLRVQSEKAKRFIELAGEKKTVEIGLWLDGLDRQREALREHENRLHYAHAQYDEIEQKIDRLAQEMDEGYLKVQKEAAEAEELKAAAQKCEDTAVEDESQVSIIENNIEHNNQNINRIDTDLDTLKNSGDQDRAELQRIKQELFGKQAEKEEHLARLAAYEKDVFELSRQSDDMSARIERYTAELSSYNLKITDLRLEANSALSSIAGVKDRVAAIAADVAQRSEKQERAGESIEACARQLGELNERAQGLQNSLKGYQLKMETRQQKLQQINGRANELSLQFSSKKQRAAMLQDLEKHLEGFSHSVKVVMKERQRGYLEGIYGPVSRLIHVPTEYAVAVETALGGAVQNIVVENEENAKSAIAFLKKNDGGRATFLPVSSVKGSLLSEKNLNSSEGFIGIASELIDNDPRYDGIFKNLLGRTVITRDLDSAVNMARKFGYRFRIVTLDGQLVHAGGSLTGGSLNKNIGLLSRAGEIETLNKEAELIKSEIEQNIEHKKAATAELSALEAQVGGIQGELTTLQENVIRLEGERRRYEEQAVAFREDIEALRREESDCIEKIGGFEKAAEQAQQRMREIENKVSAAQEELEKLGVDHHEILSKRNRQTEELTGIKIACVGCEKDMESLKRQIVEIEQAFNDRTGRMESLAVEKAGLEERNKQELEQARRLKEQAALLREEAAGKLEQAKRKNEERQEFERKTVELRTAERDLLEDKEKISKELARLEERKLSSQAEYDSLISRLWEEYELTRSDAEKTAGRIADPGAARLLLNQLKKQIKDLGNVNMGAIDEYREVSQRYQFLSTQCADVEKSKSELSELIRELTSKMECVFAQQFQEINRNFSTTFVELFGGGRAHLELTEPDSVLTSGIEIIVQPPGKIIKNLSSLSGGEQAFVAIALFFAILKVRPSPFCVLDEIEAALDDANVSRFAAYLRRMCGNTQFIVITHRRGTMDEADRLYGVTMQDEGVSKLLSLDVSELVQKFGIHA